MTNQYVNDRPLHVGSADVRIADYYDTAATVDSAVSIGMLDGCSFKVTGDTSTVETDNADDIDFGMTGQQAEIAASAWKNLDLDVLYHLLGEMGSLTTTAASEPVSVTNERITLTSEIPQRLQHKSADTAGCTILSVTDSGGKTVYQVDTDYRTAVTPFGYTTIMRLDSGTIADGQQVCVSYTYTPIQSRKLTYGSSKMPVYLHVWLVNTNAEGKQFIIEIYKVSSIQSLELTLGSDKAKALMQMPISLVGKPDSRRPADDDLFSIYDEQGYEGAVSS